MDKVYFKNFNAIRIIAAILVVFSHIVTDKSISLNSYNWVPLGTIAVTLFFVLSGFLITFLLLKEREITGRIHLKKFYIRRVLRIWPLYFVVLFLGWIIFYEQITLPSLLYSIFFLPHVALIYKMLPDVIDPIWSIGVEEQFYLFFPFLLIFFNSCKKRVVIISGFIICLWSLKMYTSFNTSNEVVLFINDYLYLARFDSMLIGALGAIWYNNKSPFFAKIIYSKILQYLFYTSLFALLYYNIVLNGPVIHQLYSLIYLVIILNLGTNNNSILNMENRIMNHLGKLSYSLYLTHKFVIFYFTDILFNIFLENKYLTILSILILSIAVSQISYTFVEKFFLKYKSRFSLVHTKS